MDISEKRKINRNIIQMIPQDVPGEEGLVQVDVTWGSIQPILAADGVETIGEVEVNDHLEKGTKVIDARMHDSSGTPTIKNSKNIPHSAIVDRMDELNKEEQTIIFCNGPQCPQSPTAINALLETGYPADKILYYRGGMHDWITLGLPVDKVKI